MIRKFEQFANLNENKTIKLAPSDSEGQNTWTHKAYTMLHERGEEPSAEDEAVWDQLSILDIAQLLKGQELVTYEGYGGENKLGNLPEYVQNRLYRDCEHLEGSHRTYDTWDTCDLLVPKNNPNSEVAIFKINRSKTRGSSIVLKPAHYEKIMVVTHKVTKTL